jgi:transcriptional regulator with XRE-family HTH domain
VASGPETEQAGLRFGGLLRQLRTDAGLTQDELAEAAQVSQRAISDLERGINATARKDTAVLLAGALGLDGAGAPATASRTLPRDIAGFTGRQDELGQLMARWAEAGAQRSRCIPRGMSGCSVLG